MSDKTFIEIWHEDEDCHSNWFATKSVSRWKDGSSSLGMNTWQVNGTDLHIYDKEDLAALRKLLEAIEEEFNETE